MPNGYETITESLSDIFKEIQRLRILLLPYCKTKNALDTHAKMEKELYKLELILKTENKDKR